MAQIAFLLKLSLKQNISLSVNIISSITHVKNHETYPKKRKGREIRLLKALLSNKGTKTLVERLNIIVS